MFLSKVKKLFAVALSASLLLCIMPSGQVVDAATAQVKIPVLLYHVVTAKPSGQYQYSLTEFKKEMDYLHSNKYTTLSIDQYFNILNKTTSMPNKPVLLTFDDCTSDFYTNVFPILKQYGMKATQFAVSNWIDTSGHLTSTQLRTLLANGIDIQNHTTTHQDLTGLSYSQQNTLINNANTKIKSITAKSTICVAYPYGAHNSNSSSVLKALGYKGGFIAWGSFSTDTTDKYALPRIVVLNGDSSSVIIRKLTTGQ